MDIYINRFAFAIAFMNGPRALGQHTMGSMKVALIFLPSWLPYAPPLGISCIKSVLQEAGHEAKTFDYNVKLWRRYRRELPTAWGMLDSDKWIERESYDREIEPIIGEFYKELVKDLLVYGAQAVGFSIYNTNYIATHRSIKWIRKLIPDIKIFYGGAEATRARIKLDFEYGHIDAAVMGEGEQSTVDLIDYWSGVKTSNFIPGVALKEDGKVIYGPSRPLLKLSELPFPSFDDNNFDDYNGHCILLEFSRGCVAKCNFCGETKFWQSFRSKRADQLINEMKYCIEYYGVKEFRIVDSLMNGNHRLLEEFVDLILKEKLDVSWYGFCRIHTKLTPKLLSKMRKAGCAYVNFGIESGSQKVLNLMRKQYKIKEIFQVVRNAHKVGMQVHTQILIGFPGEGWWQFMETLFMLYRLRKEFSKVYPGIPLSISNDVDLYKEREKFGVVMNEDTHMDHWRTRFYTNTFVIRKFRHHLLVRFLNWLKIAQGYPLT